MCSTQSQTRLEFTGVTEILEFVLASSTTTRPLDLQVRGVSNLDGGEITDFDFVYDCSNHVKRCHTYLSHPRTRNEEILDVAGLEGYLQGDRDHNFHHDIGHVYRGRTSFLLSWARDRVKSDSDLNAGIYFEHSFQNFPNTLHIAKLATFVSYGGQVRVKFLHYQPERRLVGLSDQWPPESQHCLHVRTVWKWIPDIPNIPPPIECRPLHTWETLLQRGMVGRCTGRLTDEYTSQVDVTPPTTSRTESLRSDESWLDVGTTTL